MLICEQVALGEHLAQVARLWLRMEWPKWALTAMNPVPVPRSGWGAAKHGGHASPEVHVAGPAHGPDASMRMGPGGYAWRGPGWSQLHECGEPTADRRGRACV